MLSNHWIVLLVDLLAPESGTKLTLLACVSQFHGLARYHFRVRIALTESFQTCLLKGPDFDCLSTG